MKNDSSDQLSNLDDLQHALRSLPNWEGMNAYEKTKRCCNELTKRGQRIPSWMIIRDIIGKGSANDINRGKDDFRREHGDSLRKMSGFLKGVPEELTPHVLGFWTTAIELVRREFDQQVLGWESQIELADAAMVKAESQRDHAVNQVQACQAQIAGMEEAIKTLQGQVATERSARDQAERMYEASRAELSGQRDVLRSALEKSQEELSKAITRLEGVEKHALIQIDRARTDAQNRVEQLEAQYKLKINDQVLELTRVNNQLNESRSQLTIAKQNLALKVQEGETLQQSLKQAHEQVEFYKSHNTALMTTMSQTQSGVQAPKRKMLRRKRKELTNPKSAPEESPRRVPRRSA